MVFKEILYIYSTAIILDYLLRGLINTTSASIRVKDGGGREPRSCRFPSFKNLTPPNGLNQGLLVLWVPHNDAKSIVNIASKPSAWWFTAGWLSNSTRAIQRPSNHSWTSERLKNLLCTVTGFIHHQHENIIFLKCNTVVTSNNTCYHMEIYSIIVTSHKHKCSH